MYVSIVDYGTGNLNSVSKALEAAATKINKKINIRISNKPKDILDSDKIILPGSRVAAPIASSMFDFLFKKRISNA